MRDLTPYQTAIARAVLDNVLHAQGGLFTVEMPEGSGVDELSAQMDLLLMTLHVHDGGRLLQVSPDGEDGVSARLAGYLREGALCGLWSARPGVVRLGRAEHRSLTHEQLVSVTGPLALIEVREAQRLDRETYERCLLPLAVASNATVVLYGTPWNGETFFEEVKQRNRERETAGDPRRHFRVTWDRVAEELPGYRERVLAERDRLGETHPEFQTRYALRPVQPAGPLLTARQVRGLAGTHSRRHVPIPGGPTRASVVVTRLPAEAGAPVLFAGIGATAVVTVAEEEAGGGLRVLEHRWVQAPSTAALAGRVAKLLGETWRCRRVAGDLARVGAGQATDFRRSFEHALGRVAVAWTGPDDTRDSERLLALIAAANTGRLTVYTADGTPECRALRRELESATAAFGADGLVRVRMPQPDEGFLRGLVLLVGHALARSDERMDVLHPALAS